MRDISIDIRVSIRQAMKKLSQEGGKCLVVTDKKNKLLGTLSDGDIRKAILNGATSGDTIDSFYQHSPTVLYYNNYSISEAKHLFTEHKFDLIPIVDNHGTLKDVLFWESIFGSGNSGNKNDLDIPVVIMAGGKGTRLEPFTKVLPKPLVPVHEKPVIEHIIERFTKVGCNEFYLTLNYKGRILKAYFDELDPEYRIQFIEEKESLGTAGSLNLLEGKIDEPFFVTNCDIIIKADYISLQDFHIKGGYDITLVASAKEYIIPYGTCKLNKQGHLLKIDEKPSYDFLINTGLYMLNPKVLKLIPKNTFFHITHLIENVKSQGMNVGVFPIDDDAWVDVGEWAEYKKAVEQL